MSDNETPDDPNNCNACDYVNCSPCEHHFWQYHGIEARNCLCASCAVKRGDWSDPEDFFRHPVGVNQKPEFVDNPYVEIEKRIIDYVQTEPEFKIGNRHGRLGISSPQSMSVQDINPSTRQILESLQHYRQLVMASMGMRMSGIVVETVNPKMPNDSGEQQQ